MSPYEAYVTFLAVKRHFSPGSTYDYHKYNGRIKAPRQSFENKNDRYFFEKLARKRDLVNFCVANMSDNPKCWVGDLLTDQAEEKYNRYIKTTESITYVLERQLVLFDCPFDELFIFKDGKHPPILDAYNEGSVHAEVLAVLDGLVGFTDHWEKYSWDPTVKAAVHRIQKLRGFVDYHPASITKAIKKLFSREASSGS